MRTVNILLLSLFLSFASPLVASAQNKATVVDLGDGVMVPITSSGQPVEPEFVDQAVDKPILWNKGWDQVIGNRPKIDATVPLELRTFQQVLGYPGLTYTTPQIEHWGEQRYFVSPKKIFAKAILLVDKGEFLEGGPFEWSLNRQFFMSFHNILRKDVNRGWIGAWTDPVRGEKVWFFLMSDDERFATKPITFEWPY